MASIFPMPLHSLLESVETLSVLVDQGRELRGRDDAAPGSQEKNDRMTDETLDNIRTLVRCIADAHQRGDLDAMVKRDAEELAET